MSATSPALFIPGLVSITFRQLTPQHIIALAARAGLRSIEWGGDVHCPHGDTATAQKIASATTEAGLLVAAYGSYYRAGVPQKSPPFQAVLETAIALGAPLIRIWAGNTPSASTSADLRKTITDDCLRCAQTAAPHGITVALEYHDNTLTDTPQSCDTLLRQAAHPNLRCLWQPNVDADAAFLADSLERIIPHLANIHIFHWHPGHQRRPLAEGRQKWLPLLRRLAQTGTPRHLLIEFVLNDHPDQLLADAAALHDFIQTSLSLPPSNSDY